LLLSTLWDPQGMDFVLDFFSRVAVQIPCQQVSFRPQKIALALEKKIAKW
jgi:hypothetical protein